MLLLHRNNNFELNRKDWVCKLHLPKLFTWETFRERETKKDQKKFQKVRPISFGRRKHFEQTKATTNSWRRTADETDRKNFTEVVDTEFSKWLPSWALVLVARRWTSALKEPLSMPMSWTCALAWFEELLLVFHDLFGYWFELTQRVTHYYRNESGNDLIECSFTFPIIESAAICSFEHQLEGICQNRSLSSIIFSFATHLHIDPGEDVVVGRVTERQEARAIYDKAIKRGDRSALLERDESGSGDLFTIMIGNVPINKR